MSITDSFRDYAWDLDRAQDILALARVTPVSGGTFAQTYITLHCPGTDAVDAAAAKWSEETGAKVTPFWYAGQYQAETGVAWAILRAVFIPLLPPRGTEAGVIAAAEAGAAA